MMVQTSLHQGWIRGPSKNGNLVPSSPSLLLLLTWFRLQPSTGMASEFRIRRQTGRNFSSAESIVYQVERLPTGLQDVVSSSFKEYVSLLKE
ncbi:hypothetical protein M408DRAFT_326804 [Serendipita vermifera MAFF 305830]|uniref:Uncharacterized protein n=1 Tax=Serendipita vermifera MAFF 305830 TaxID=933852 RepID=A0A0C3B5P6_SERVB|nr:hypothetical protein M408DRAFT_326804 [Serendipita vermifera MAFF 305830]